MVFSTGKFQVTWLCKMTKYFSWARISTICWFWFGVITFRNWSIDFRFELCVDILDYLQELVVFEQSVTDSLDKSKSNSMTPQGQCRLTPLIQVIQDMATLYDISVRILFRLHSKLDTDLLSGHRQRFLKLFEAIKMFFKHAQTFQYFKTLIQVPTLPEVRFLYSKDHN